VTVDHVSLQTPAETVVLQPNWVDDGSWGSGVWMSGQGAFTAAIIAYDPNGGMLCSTSPRFYAAGPSGQCGVAGSAVPGFSLHRPPEDTPTPAPPTPAPPPTVAPATGCTGFSSWTSDATAEVYSDTALRTWDSFGGAFRIHIRIAPAELGDHVTDITLVGRVITTSTDFDLPGDVPTPGDRDIDLAREAPDTFDTQEPLQWPGCTGCDIYSPVNVTVHLDNGNTCSGVVPLTQKSGYFDHDCRCL